MKFGRYLILTLVSVLMPLSGAAQNTTNPPGIYPGAHNPVVTVPVFYGTNSPTLAALPGSIYNQYDVTGTNFIQQWVATGGAGDTNWTPSQIIGAGTGNALTNNSSRQTFFGPQSFNNPANKFTGDGGSVTNLQSTNLVGVLPSGILTSGTTNGAGHLLVINPNGNRYVTYDASSLSNLNANAMAVASPTNNGLMQSNLLVYYTSGVQGNASFNSMPIVYNTYLAHGVGYSATMLTNDVNFALASGAALLRQPFIINVDDGMFTNYRDANGNLTLNTNLWPDPGGVTNYIAYVHSAGMLIIPYLEDRDFTQSGVSCGTTNFAFDGNYLGAVGFDGVKLDPNKFNVQANPTSITNCFLDCLLFDQYFRAASTRPQCYFFHDIPPPQIFPNAFFAGLFPGTMFRFISENVAPSPFTYFTNMLYRLDDNYNYRQPWMSSHTWVLPQEFANNLDGVAGFTTVQSHCLGNMINIFGGLMMFTVLNGATAQQSYWMTNSEWLRMDVDSGRNVPVIVPSAGSSLTTFLTYKRNLADFEPGAFAVGIQNRTTNSTQSVTLSLTNFGCEASLPYVIRDPLLKTNLATVMGSGTFNLSVVAMDAQLLRIYPAATPIPITTYLGMQNVTILGNGAANYNGIGLGTWFNAGYGVYLPAATSGFSVVEIPNWQSYVADGRTNFSLTLNLLTTNNPFTDKIALQLISRTNWPGGYWNNAGTASAFFYNDSFASNSNSFAITRTWTIPYTTLTNMQYLSFDIENNNTTTNIWWLNAVFSNY